MQLVAFAVGNYICLSHQINMMTLRYIYKKYIIDTTCKLYSRNAFMIFIFLLQNSPEIFDFTRQLHILLRGERSTKDGLHYTITTHRVDLRYTHSSQYLVRTKGDDRGLVLWLCHL